MRDLVMSDTLFRGWFQSVRHHVGNGGEIDLTRPDSGR